MSKNLLTLGAGIESVENYLILKKFDCNIIAVDKNPNAPGLKYADHFVKASIHNYSEILRKVKKIKTKIDGVLPFGDISYIATRLCKYFKINSIPLKSAKITSDKLLFKKEFKNHLNIPFFKKIKNFSQLNHLVKSNKKKFIIKPVDNSGARGVILLNNKTNLRWAFNYCIKYSKKKHLIAEEYIEGPQLSTEGIVHNGKYVHLCSFDRNYEFIKKYRPFVIENGGSTPSKIGDKYIFEINKILSKVSKKLKLKNATLKGDLVINNNKIYLIEVATRLSGGWLSSITIPHSTGVNIVEYVINNSLGIGSDIKKFFPKYKKNIVQRYLFPKEMRIKSIKFKNKSFLKNKNIISFKIFKNKSKLNEKIDSHASRIGHVIVKSSNKKKGILLVKKIINNVKVNYYSKKN